MKRLFEKSSPSHRAQALIEFALVLPLILMLIFGIIEFGRLIFTYISATSASREGARYGSAAGPNASGLPRYLDCAGMRSAAERVGVLSGISDNNIYIHYDEGPGNVGFGGCVPSEDIADDSVPLGYRVVISVTASYQPIVPIIDPYTITSVTARTIVKNVAAGDAIVPPSPPETSVSFSSSVTPARDESYTGPNVVTFVLAQPVTQNVTVYFSLGGTATVNQDYTIDTLGPVTIPAGGVSTSVVINFIDDDLNEDNETIILHIVDAQGAIPAVPYDHTLTIIDNDAAPDVYFTESAQLVPESVGQIVVTARLSRLTGRPVTVPFVAVDGTAQMGSDYEVITPNPIVIQPQTWATSIYITITNDIMDEDDETFSINMGTPTNANMIEPSQESIVIQDDDDPPILTFATIFQNVTERTHAVAVGMHLSAPSSRPITVPYLLTGNATNGLDYQMVSPNPIIIPPGTMDMDINLNVIEDGDNTEGTETIILTMNNPINATLGTPYIHTVYITSLTVSFTTDSQAASEGVGQMYVTLQLSEVSANNVTVPFTLGGSATVNVDYTITPSPVVIPAGTISTTLTINVVQDTLNEIDEAIVISMGQPVNAARGTYIVHTAWIINDDLAPNVSWQMANATVPEAGPALSVHAVLNTPSGQSVVVPFTVQGTANQGTDYTYTPSPVTIPPGQTSVTVTITPINDSIFEGDETVRLIMGSPINANKVEPSELTVTIIDDDAPTCSIYHPYPLLIDVKPTGEPKYYRVIWQGIQNTDSHALQLEYATITWPNVGHKVPYLTSADWIAPFVTTSPDWAGTEWISPKTITWPADTPNSNLIMAANPSNQYTMQFDFDKDLLEGDYSVTLIFHIVGTNYDCQPITGTYNNYVP